MKYYYKTIIFLTSNLYFIFQSYRGRKPSGAAGVTPLSAGTSSIVPPEANGGTVIPTGAQPPSRPSPQPVVPPTVQQPMPVQQQPMVSFVFRTFINKVFTKFVLMLIIFEIDEQLIFF